MTRSHWARAAVAAWVVFLLVTCARPLFKPTSGTVFVTYATAGREFDAGRKLYDVWHPYTDNFRYSPLVAAGFVPFTHLPLGVGGALWRVLAAAVFLTGLLAWARRVAPDVPLGKVFVFALPLSVGSLSNGQANTHVLGLMLWAAVLASGGRWPLAAGLVAAAALFKGYPLALGLLLAVAAPVRFGLPLAVAIAAGLGLPYLLQSPEYVGSQYDYWLANLSRDDRTTLPPHAGYQDVHMLFKVAGVYLPLGTYRPVQAAAGAVAAAVVVWQLWRGVGRERVALNALVVGLCWMVLFGPSTESSTFILMAPLMARELADRAGRPGWSRAAAVGGAVLFVVSVGVFAFPHAVHRPVIGLGVQPLAALLLAVAAVGRVIATRPESLAVDQPAAGPPLRQAA
jgi:hypothetical protein